MSNVTEQYNEMLKVADIVSNKLTNDQVDDIASTMNKVLEASEELKAISSLPSNNGVEESTETRVGDESLVTISVNPNTGERVVTGLGKEVNKEDEDFITETFEDLLENTEASDCILDMNFTDDMIKEAASDKFNNLMPSDAIEFANLIREYQNDSTIDVYSRLPKSIKATIDADALEIVGDNSFINHKQLINMKKSVAVNLVEEFILDLGADKIQIDFQKEMDGLYNELKDEMKEMSIESFNEQVTRLREMSDTIREESPEKADKLLVIADNMENGYTYEKLYNAISEKRIKVRKYDMEKPNRIYATFNGKYEKSAYNIYDIGMIPAILRRHFDTEEVSNEKIMRFVLSFCEYCRNMKPENIEEHAFMYYTINNIVWLQLGTKMNDEFTKGLLANIKKVLDLFY